jgi:hypothetical protein
MGFLINLCISIRIYDIALTAYRSPNQFQIIDREIKRIRASASVIFDAIRPARRCFVAGLVNVPNQQLPMKAINISAGKSPRSDERSVINVSFAAAAANAAYFEFVGKI